MLGCLLIALGRFTPLWSPYFHFFPGACLFRHSEKYALLAALGVVVLAVRGLPALAADSARALRVAVAAVAALTLLALVVRARGPAVASELRVETARASENRIRDNR